MHTFFLKITAMLLLLIVFLSIVLKTLGFGCCKPEKPINPNPPTTEFTTQVTEPSTAEPESTTQTTEPSTAEPESTTQTTEPSTAEPESTTQVTEPSTAEPESTTQTTEPSTAEPESTTQTTEPSTTEPESTTQTTEPSTAEPESTTQTTEPSTTEPESTTQATEPSTAEPESTTQTTEPSTTEPESTTQTTTQPTTQGTTSEPTTSIEIGPQIRTVNQSLFAPFGGTGNDIFTGIDNTPDGGYVACGRSTSTDQDLSGVPNSSWSEYSFVVKFDKDGDVVWKKSVGSSTRPYYLEGIAALSDGSVVTVGHIKNSTQNAQNETLIACIIKYSATGQLIWQKNYDGSKADVFNCVCATSKGFAVGGKTESIDGDFDFVKKLGDASPIIISFDSNANIIWKTSIPGDNGGSIEDIDADQYDNVFVTCLTTSTQGSFAAFEGLGMGYSDTVVLKHDSAGNYIWNYVIASCARDEFCAIAADDKGGCVVAGNYELIGASATNGTLSGIHNCGGVDALTMHIDLNGKRKWVNRIAGYGNDYITEITRVADGGYAVVGYTTSSDRDFSDINYVEGPDSFIGFITPGGNTVDIKGHGGSNEDRLNCVAYSPLGGVMALGQTTSKDEAFDGMNSHLNDIYLIIFGFLPFTGYIVKYRVSISKY